MNQFFTYSIYYHQNEFHRLLKQIEDCISLNSGITHYHIKINDFQGPHIELTIVLYKDSIVDPLNLLSNQLDNFLNEEPSGYFGLEKTSHELFADFPNNTIHYGISDWIVPFWCKNVSWEQYNKIAVIICAIFQKYKEQTQDSLTEIGLQIIAIFCVAAKKDNKASKVFIESLIELELKNYPDKTFEKINKLTSENYENNRETIIDYIKEASLKGGDFSENWQVMWFDFIAQFTNGSNLDIGVFPRLVFENLNYKELIFILKMFSMGLADINNGN